MANPLSIHNIKPCLEVCVCVQNSCYFLNKVILFQLFVKATFFSEVCKCRGNIFKDYLNEQNNSKSVELNFGFGLYSADLQGTKNPIKML